MYVDNLITSVPSEKRATSFYLQTRAIFSDASMNMCKWNCSSKVVMKEIKEEVQCDEEIPKLLGMIWFRETDEIRLAKVANLSSDKVNKRSVLKTISSRFDLCGIYSQVLIRTKLFLEDLWRENISWDKVLSDDKAKEWRAIAKEVVAAESLNMNRYIGINESEKEIYYSLITFTDASKVAYAAAV